MAKLRISKRKLFEALRYTPHPGQQLVHDSTAPRRVVACGSRWGKSTACAAEAVAALLEPSESSLGWCVAPTLDLADRVFAVVVRLFQEHLPHHIVEYVPRERRLVVANLGGGRSELQAKSTDSPASLLGVALDFVILDEAAQVQRATWEGYLLPRLVDRRGWALVVSSPRGGGWFHAMFRRGQNPSVTDFKSWQSPSWTNPHLDREVIEAERASMSRDAFAQEFEAQFIGVGHEACFTCNGPNSSVPAVRMVRAGRRIPTCCDCGELVDDDGNSILNRSPNGTARVKLITIEDDDGTSAFVEDLYRLEAQASVPEHT